MLLPACHCYIIVLLSTSNVRTLSHKCRYTLSLRMVLPPQLLSLSTSNVYVHGQYAEDIQKHCMNNMFLALPASYSYIVIFLSTRNVPPHPLQHPRTCQHNMHFCLSTSNAHVLVQQSCTSAVLAHHSCACPQVTCSYNNPVLVHQ